MKIGTVLARSILAHPFDFEWSIQGFGMFRLYLTKEIRLHVWSQKHAVEKVTTIHTHPWHFESHVLQGQLVDRLYMIVPGGDVTHTEQLIRCGPGGCAVGLSAEVSLRHMSDRGFVAGESYKLFASSLHESIPTPGCITVVRREFLPDSEHACVYYPIGEQWVSAEPRLATKQEIQEMSEVALAVKP